MLVFPDYQFAAFRKLWGTLETGFQTCGTDAKISLKYLKIN